MTHIRPAGEADFAAITAIYRAAVLGGTASFELDPPDESEMRRRWHAVTEAGFPYIVAVDGAGEILGYAYFTQYRPRPAYRFSVENSIYIAPNAQRTGVGSRLLNEIIRLATAKGHRQMIAIIGDSQHQASIGLHRRAGFHFCGTIHSVGFKFGRWLDSVMMQCPLGEGDQTTPTA